MRVVEEQHQQVRIRQADARPEVRPPHHLRRQRPDGVRSDRLRKNCETAAGSIKVRVCFGRRVKRRRSSPQAAFLLPILQQLMADGVAASRFSEIQEPEAVIVAPTRELINQIYQEARKFSFG